MVIALKVQTGLSERVLVRESDGKAGTWRGDSCHSPSSHMKEQEMRKKVSSYYTQHDRCQSSTQQVSITTNQENPVKDKLVGESPMEGLGDRW